MIKSAILTAVVAISLTGCATDFEKFYVSDVGGKPLKDFPYAIVAKGDPEVLPGTDPSADRDNLIRRGYGRIGQSAFTAAETNASDARAMGRSLGVSIVMIYSAYAETMKGSIPSTRRSNQYSTVTTPSGSNFTIKTPQESTTFQQWEVVRHHFLATYWAKLKRPILGVQTAELPYDLRRKVDSNSGLLVEYVIRDSVAYEEDVIEGDAILSIDGIPLSGPEDLQSAIADRQGRDVDLLIYRDGRKIEKRLRLGRTE